MEELIIALSALEGDVSTLESLCNGVPFLCWPSFADQFYDSIFVMNLKLGRDLTKMKMD
jgi:UDP:flavonoid glycosyltransferase YjiC (YdhE family)